MHDGVRWRQGRDDSERFGGNGLESYPGSEFKPPEGMFVYTKSLLDWSELG
jgi:hypothetical protein